MDLKRKLIGALFAAVAGSGLLIACGPESGAACEFDTECSDGELCFDGFCAHECTSTAADCIDDEVCTSRAPATGSVCVVPGGTVVNNDNNDNNDQQCTTNEECQVGNPDGYCDDGVCKTMGTAKEYVTIEVRDATTASNRCTDTTKDEPSPGTKLSYVQLLKQDGTSLGFGQQVGYDVFNSDNAFNEVSSVLDGNPVNLTNDCAESFTYENGVALSCGGFVMVQFKDSNGATIKLTNDQQILVGVYGQTCNELFDKNGEDFYNVYLCDTFSTTNDDNSSCTTKLTSSAQNGITTVNVVLPN